MVYENNNNQRIRDTYKKSKIASVIPTGKRLVYDLTIKDDHNYLAHGFINHNSTPNVQNLPRDKKIRGIFIAEKDYKLFSCDLAQAELRIMADYSNDKVMLKWIQDGIDIHWVACLNLFYHNQKIEYDPNNSEHKRYRKLTKLCNFGGLYGGKDEKKVQSVNEKLDRKEEKLTLETARAHSEWFNSTFKRIHKYLKEMEDFILTYGYIDNIFGGRRRLSDAFSSEKYLRAEAVRQGINAQIQGTASHICQFAYIRVDKWFRENNMKSRVLWTVHDEIDGEVHNSEIELIKSNLERLMTSKEYPIDRIKVPLDADLTIFNERWGS